MIAAIEKINPNELFKSIETMFAMSAISAMNNH
jgi:hypothetical protein